MTRFPGRHWHLLSLIARCPGAVDLIRSTPALAFALASLWVFRQPAPRRPLRSVRSLLRKPQSHTAGWLGFPGTRSTVRVLRKLPPGECHVPNLLHLRQLCGTHAKALRHMSLLGTENLRLMVKSGEAYHLGSAYLAEMGASPAPEWLDREPRTLQDVLWLRERLGDEEPVTFHSHAHLLRIHDQLVQRIGRSDLTAADRIALPDPPFPGASTAGLQLEPITTEAGLIMESAAQSNCVGAYGRRVRRGGLCIYRVLAPERATLSITRSRDGSWTVSELKGYHNTPVDGRTTIAVQEWLDASNDGDPGPNIRDNPA